ncbi:dienelactone hydrolase family protein [Picrophilus oshimae]|uniref:Carboxymethylenebutenolidase n=1 Tax=Picrophilus torridus (strain ATCC 700027 / DSM 9790 / JCM 10055 / NBRC 100828 / KAW 2/3) TaxID=1122961 RepID=Q6KZY9_PICTO|nr:dienelactone hydrolase family protein [Picrophilus oshimae]AAT43713.1 carboxymethylenebutenolidase [Picrophilus oshimae DSM 9789]
MADIRYRSGDDEIDAYITGSNNEKAVIVIHEIFGLDEHTKSVADRLADIGYTAMAPDLFSSRYFSSRISKNDIYKTMDFIMSIPPGKQRDNDFRMHKLMEMDENERRSIEKVNELLFVNRPVDLLTEYLKDGVLYLKSRGIKKVGSVGFCFGGGMSINLGCTGTVDATAIYYGENPEPLEKLKNVNAVIGFYAGEDKRITSKVPDLISELYKYNKEVTVKIYPGAYHAFFNSTRPKIYNDAAARDSWELLVQFFNNHL